MSDVTPPQDVPGTINTEATMSLEVSPTVLRILIFATIY